jgi:hypothetical protein
VALNELVTATFNKPMNPSTINSNSFIVTQAGTIVSGVVTYAGVIASFTPTNPLSATTIYTATITTLAEDVAGNPVLVDYSWTFITDAAPTVTSTSPIDNATGVALNKTITATFSVPMNSATLTASSFIVKQGNTTIAGALSYANNTVSFVPVTPLLENKVYTCTITTAVKTP